MELLTNTKYLINSQIL